MIFGEKTELMNLRLSKLPSAKFLLKTKSFFLFLGRGNPVQPALSVKYHYIILPFPGGVPKKLTLLGKIT